MSIDEETHTFDVVSCEPKPGQIDVQGTSDDGTEYVIRLAGPPAAPFSTQRPLVTINDVSGGTFRSLGAIYAVDANGTWRIIRSDEEPSRHFFEYDGTRITAQGLLMNAATSEWHAVEMSVDCPGGGAASSPL